MSPNTEHSYIAKAAIKELSSKHGNYHEKLWASTSGTVVGEIQHTPKGVWDTIEDPVDGHSDWFPETVSNLLGSTELWCDFMSLSPPEEYSEVFTGAIKKALAKLAEKSAKSGKKIVVRILFGHVISTPVDCDALMEEFTEGLDDSNSNLEIWIGAWRNCMSWNHAKIVAVDGKHLHTGGHNLWDTAYLQVDPIHDTSIQLEGKVAIQAHQFANDQWEYIKTEQSTLKGCVLSTSQWVVRKCIRSCLVPMSTRVDISEWPINKATQFAPLFHKDILPLSTTPTEEEEERSKEVKILSLGRYGDMGCDDARSSDGAFIAMFDAAKSSIRLFLQDLGPVNRTVGGRKISYLSWPKKYMRVWAKAMFERDVDVEIVLSNPTSGEERGLYSNGWSCEEVAAEIIKAMRELYPNASQAEIKKKAVDNLRICWLRTKKGNEWQTGCKVGLHSKFFIVDDVCTYVGSQNLYEFDLAEWGVAIDDKRQTEDFMTTLWNPMWSCSYLDGSDCNPEKVMEILDVDRDPRDEISIPKRDIAVMALNINVEQVKKSKFFIEGKE